jgi:hypothetical protein
MAATTDYSPETTVRAGVHDISFLEQYRFPASPPFSPPMKGSDAKSLYTPINPALDRMFPRSPPESPRGGLKRKFSTNLQSALSGIMTPPSTPPTLSRSSTFSKSNECAVFPTNRRPAVVSRPTLVTVDFDGSPSRRFPSRASSWSSNYSSSVATPRSSKDALARCKDYAALSTDAQFPIASPSPLYYSSGSTPPPNTPMNALSGMMIYNSTKPFEPFPAFYAGPSSLSTVSTPVVEFVPQYPNLPRPEDFNLSDCEMGAAKPRRGRNPSLSHRPSKRKLFLMPCSKAVLVLTKYRQLRYYYSGIPLNVKEHGPNLPIFLVSLCSSLEHRRRFLDGAYWGISGASGCIFDFLFPDH